MLVVSKSHENPYELMIHAASTTEFEGISESEPSTLRPNKAGSKRGSNVDSSPLETSDSWANEEVAAFIPSRQGVPISKPKSKSKLVEKLNAESFAG